MHLIESIKLKFGSSIGQPAQELHDATVTLIIGPNNSGKSLLLKEINDSLREGRKSSDFSILDEITFTPHSVQEAVTDVQQNVATTSIVGNRASTDHVYYSRKGEEQQFHEPSLRKFLGAPTTESNEFKAYAKFHTIKLDGQYRIALVNDNELKDLTRPQTNRLAQLFVDDATRAILRDVIYSSLKTYLVVDPTHIGRVRLRLSKVAPSSLQIERGITTESVEFHSKSLHIKDASDGIKAFCGILVEQYVGAPKILLIDEPEAFLHPSLAFMLGKIAAARAQAAGNQLIVATHSASFLKGCLQSGAKVNVVRLTYSGVVGTARLLSNAKLVDFMRNPLLRSVGVLNGLFYEGVVVTEADTDRAFYDEINERLLLQDKDRGARNCLFLNAQNKQTVHTILTPLRELGIPAAGIVDIDALKEGGTTWANLMGAGGVPSITASGYAQMRSNLHVQLTAAGDMKKNGGIALLSGANLQAAENLIDALGEYGIFIVPGGEVEAWLKSLEVPGHGPQWLIPMFQRMGDNPSNAAFVKASNGDVWDFMAGISKWLADTQRKGLQS
jgi:predicted ATPase